MFCPRFFEPMNRILVIQNVFYFHFFHVNEIIFHKQDVLSFIPARMQ